jgi:stage II sporulation protein GA (sporulation sigma-E factor processing peptidase)
MVYGTFKAKTFKKFINQLLMFYLISFTFGGISYMLLFEIDSSKLILKANHFIGLYPVKVAMVAGFIGMTLIIIFAKLFKKNFFEKNIVYKIEIGYAGKKVLLNVLLDSGNLLKAPISYEDVIIAEKNSLKDLLSLDILKNINNIINGKWIDNSEYNIEKNNIRIIPFSSLGNENGVLFGFKVDYVKIFADEEIFRKDVVIGIYNGKLTKTNLYSGLIGLNLLEGDKKHEFIKSA